MMYDRMRLVLRRTLVVMMVFYVSGCIEARSSKGAEPIIESLTCSKNDVKIRINSRFKEAYLKADFFATYDHDINLEEMPYEIVTMPFICNVIALIWISGKRYSIPSMDEELYHSFKTVKKIFRLSYPQTSWKGKLVPEKLVKFSDTFPKVEKSKERRALLFSGGLDSTSSLLYHNKEKLLLITAWGQYDNPLKEVGAWEERKRRVERVASLYGHTNTFIKSNYAEFFNWRVVNSLSREIENWRVSAVDGIGWSGLVAPIFFAKKCSALYIASSNSWYHTYIDCINPYVDSSMLFANYRLIHDQFDFTRLDKAVYIHRTCEKKGLHKPYVKVCQRSRLWGDSNCCDCKKCLLTILEFCSAGADHRDYGFPVSLSTAVKRSLDLLRGSVEYETMWHYMDIQLTMKKMLDTYDSSVVRAITPFLKMNLVKTKISDKRLAIKSKIDWNDFTKLIPSVKVPSTLRDDKWEVERKASAALK